MAQIPSQNCTFCSKLATLYCFDCQQCLCTQCQKNIHDIVAVCRDHKVGDIHKAGNRINKPVPVCDVHNKEFLYYCDKCDCLTCKECITSSHNGHITKEIKNIADTRRKDVDQIINKLKTKVEEIKKTLKTIEGSHSLQIHSECDSFIKNVGKTSEEMYEIIDNYKHINMTTASDFQENEEQDLKRKLVFFQRLHNESSDRLLKFENLVQEPHDSTFFKGWKCLQTEFQIITEESEQQLSCPQQIPSFQPDTFRRAVIDKIDEQFQMGLKENKKTVRELQEENCKLKAEVKIKLDEIEKLSNDLDTRADLTNKMRIHFEDKVKELESKLKHTKDNNTTKALTGSLSSHHISNQLTSGPKADDQTESLRRRSSTANFKTSEGLLIHVHEGNILNLKVDCIVNAANESLSHGGGLADVISRAAGYSFQQESDDYVQRHGKLMVTECCTTFAGSLPYQCVIHAVGPRWYNYTDKRKCANDLEETIKNCLKEAEKKMMTSVALPAIGSGIFVVPREVCCIQYCNAVKNYSNIFGRATCLREIHFIDKDTFLVGYIQKEFKENLNIDPAVKYSGSRVSNLSGQSLSKNDNTPKYARSLSDDAAKVGKYSGSTYGKHSHSSTVKQEKFKKQYMTAKGFKVHVVQDDITKMSVDVIICPQDDNCLSKGRIAKAIANASNERYRTDVLGMKTVKRCEVRKIAASPSALPFKYVLHTVAPRWDKDAVYDNAKFMKELGLTIRNILKHCSDSKTISTAAIPVLGIGADGYDTPYVTYASILSKEISHELQNDKFIINELYIVTSEWGMALAVTDQLDKEILFSPCTSFQRRKRQNKDNTEGTDVDKDGQRNSTTGAIPKSRTEKLSTTVQDENLEDCVICMDTPDDPRRLQCGHVYCHNCISQHFKINNPVCPTCGSIQGVVTGNQPPGTMTIFRRFSSLAGYPECGRIEIEYIIESGRQGPEHKEEGRRFEGIRRVGYLPDNRKGQLVAKMLRVAFDRKLVFTIGDSRTTGKQGVVTWNDIHHKTNPKPYEQFGYPDDTYLDRVIDELSAKGVTEKDIGPNTAIY